MRPSKWPFLACLPHSSNSQDGEATCFPRNVGWPSTDYTALYPRLQGSSVYLSLKLLRSCARRRYNRRSISEAGRTRNQLGPQYNTSKRDISCKASRQLTHLVGRQSFYTQHKTRSALLHWAGVSLPSYKRRDLI